MKKITALMAVFLCLNVIPAHASSPKVLAIIDSGVDSSIPSIKNALVGEVCISILNSCPNKQSFMEGIGAATITQSMYSASSGWGHGTEVASAAIQTNPDVKIVEIRCASLLAGTFLNCGADMLQTALTWVANNISKYNIGAVVAPLGYDVPIGGKTAVACTSYSFDAGIQTLESLSIPVIFPVGNDYNYSAINNPACFNGVLAISAIDNLNRLALYANYTPRVDFAALGNLNVYFPGGSIKSDFGTSLSVGVFGAGWIQIENAKNLSYQAEYNLIKQTGINYTNIMVKQNVLDINIAKAVQ